MTCLDTTVFVDLRGKDSELEARADRRIGELLAVGEVLVTTRLTLAELYVGIERAPDPVREEGIVQALLGDMPILELDDQAARSYGWITAQLQKMGRPIVDMDVLIAAVAMAAGHSVTTRNAEHFRRVPGLVVEEY